MRRVRRYRLSMDFSDVIPTLVGALVTTGIVALTALAYPGVRWARRIKRDIEIVGGLPDGSPEREIWQAKVTALARRLRAYETYVPLMHRVLPFVWAVIWGVLITCFIVYPNLRDALLAEMPAFIMGIAGLVGATGYLSIAIMGGDLRGRDPDALLAREEARASLVPTDDSEGASESR